jgi:hypothetical protein
LSDGCQRQIQRLYSAGKRLKFYRFDKGYRYLRRYHRIVSVFGKYGFAQFLDQLNLSGFFAHSGPTAQGWPTGEKSIGSPHVCAWP